MLDANELALRQALEQVEEAFSGYKPIFPLSASPVITDEMQHVIEHDPYEVIGLYLFKVGTTWGDLNDFKAFLPTILRLYTFEVNRLWSSWFVFRKLSYLDFATWEENEQAVVNNFFKHLWDYILDKYRRPNCVTSCEFIGNAFDPKYYLSVWESRLDELPVRRHLAQWINSNYGVLRLGYKQVGCSSVHNRWTIRKEIQQLMEDSYFECIDEEFAHEFSQAAEHMKWIFWGIEKGLVDYFDPQT